MSHDIRTPMNAILGYATLASRHLQKPESLNDYINKITLCGNRLLSILDSVLELARIENSDNLIEENIVNIDEAIENAPANYYALILMDIQMPIMNGYLASQKIRKLDDPKKASIPIIAMTANAFSEDKQKALESGMNEHVAKPIDMNTLIPILIKYTQKL